VLRGDLRDTYWHYYPGVTLTWLETLGMAGQYLRLLLTGDGVPFSELIYSDVLSLLLPVRLPFVLLSALAVPAVYLLARKLFAAPVALLGALLLAFDPFYLAHSRVAHGDAPVAALMTLSALAFFVFLRDAQPAGNWRLALRQPYLWLSALAGGLAALTKAPGQFMALFVVLLAVIFAVRGLRAGRTAGAVIGYWLAVVAVWGAVSLLVFVLLWPSMWVDPLGTFRQMAFETFGKVESGHLVYFLGQPTLDPGLLFYLVVIPLRMTPIALIGVALSLLFFAPQLAARSQTEAAPPRSLWQSPLFLLWFFVIALLLFGNLSPKKQDRYLLPLFPTLDLLAAVGWVGVINLALAARPTAKAVRFVTTAILLLLHAAPVITYYPYYLTYFNPLLGGPQRAAEITLIGWGEGMEQVASYLNGKPNADELYVASVPAQTFLPYFAGRGENFYTNDIAFRADYVVLYVSQIQRLAPSPEIVRYFLAQPPEKEIKIKGVTYAKIYPSTPRILPDIPPEATPANIGLGDKLRLAGTIIGPQSLSLTLFWHALAPLSENYTVSVRALDADGQRLAQQDQWPVYGLLPTSQWRQGDYVADTHLLTFAPADTPRLAAFEVVVYNADNGETLGQFTVSRDQ
jgi:4-amino-4-deoxy-L-arabinose transferase-like glycosyltransferase